VGKVVGGGFTSNGDGTGGTGFGAVLSSYPSSVTAWSVKMVETANELGRGFSFTAYALCGAEPVG